MQMTVKRYNPLFKTDSTGTGRIWFMEQEGDKHRTVSGVDGGVLVRSAWTVCVPRSQPTADQQASFEIEAEYNKKQRTGYVSEHGERSAFLQPMLAQEWKGELGAVQPKLDGIRCIAKADGLWSRKGKKIVSLPHVEAALAPLFAKHPDVILDGEAYAHFDFNDVASLVRKEKNIDPEAAKAIQYWVYDTVGAGNSTERRKHLIETLGELDIWGANTPIMLVPTYYPVDREDMDAYHGNFISEGYEGSIVRLEGPYEHKRSKLLLKRKDFKDNEFPIVRIESGVGNWDGYAKRATLRLPNGQECGAGIRGSQDYLKTVLANAGRYVGKPATVRYFGETPDGSLRFPVVTDIGRADT
jgi:DNA ligase 1